MKITSNERGVTIDRDDGQQTFAQFADPAKLNPNMQLLQNPTTKQVIQIGKDQFGQLGQGLSDAGGFVPVGANVFNELNNRGAGAGVTDPGAGAGGAGAGGAGTGTGTGDSFTDYLNSLGLNFPGAGMSSSMTFGDETDYRSQIEAAQASAIATEEERQAAERKAQENYINQEFDEGVRDLTEFQSEQEQASRGQFGSNRRLSTAGEAYIGEQKERVQKQINNLEKQRETALNNLDVNLANQMSAVIKEAKAQEIQLIQLEMTAQNNKLNQLSTMLGLGLDFAREERLTNESAAQEARLQERLQFDKDKFIIGEERLNRTQDLAETKFNYDVSKDDMKTAKDAIASAAEGLIALDQYTDEEMRQLEISAGLIPGTFEAFYSGLLRDAERGETIDELKIQKSIADIARTKQLASGKSGGGGSSTSKLGSTGEGLEGLSDKQREALVPMIEAISGATSRDEALSSLAEDATIIRLQAGEQGLQVLADEINRRFPETEASQEEQKQNDATNPANQIIDIESLFSQPGSNNKVTNPNEWLVDNKKITENSLPEGWSFASNGILLDENGKMVLSDNGLVVKK